MLASRVRQRYADINITESHPKALLIDLKIKRASFPEKYCISTTGWNNKKEDEQDAAIAAICAREGFEERWTTDYAEARYRYSSEQDPKTYWLGPMYYFWPQE